MLMYVQCATVLRTVLSEPDAMLGAVLTVIDKANQTIDTVEYEATCWPHTKSVALPPRPQLCG